MSDQNDNLMNDLMDDDTDLPASWDAPTPQVSIDDLLRRLIQDADLPSLQLLAGLSDLSRSDQARVREQWALIPVARRRQVIRTLVDEAEENLDVQLGRLLRVALADEDEEARRMAIEGLWEDTEPDLVVHFVQMLYNDAEGSVRMAAAQGLGLFILAGELDELDASLAMRAEEALLSVLQNEYEPVNVRAAALESVAYSGEVGIRQLIEDAYYSPQLELRVAALVAMGRSADVRWRGAAKAELQNPDPAMRAAAAQACGELEIKSAARWLILLLEDDELAVRLAAITALGRIGGNHGQEALRILADSEIPEEAAAADLALEEMLFYAEGGNMALFDESELDVEMDRRGRGRGRRQGRRMGGWLGFLGRRRGRLRG